MSPLADQSTCQLRPLPSDPPLPLNGESIDCLKGLISRMSPSADQSTCQLRPLPSDLPLPLDGESAGLLPTA
ncbi:hypothetical protein E3N88_13542 [Mikania micrantha]|uniref:Uncharacterized protein n=1 Tax=Mikania micrantha TaxID=192012 RepID=A0A5N6P929_9ASTR|nr:hypothetical protein E3N88_13542 [Mikania micrantha]